MHYGTIEYITAEGKKIELTLVHEDDEEVLLRDGVTALRRVRLVRLCHEARTQGVSLSINELAELLVTSRSTVYRDLMALKSMGIEVPLKSLRPKGEMVEEKPAL
ncbi:MAG: DUF1670 domain-containing protein [Nitrospirae bacterium]|nr:MAG: DUF1670 domain-containing protein [Nitrospirota bacterium]